MKNVLSFFRELQKISECRASVAKHDALVLVSKVVMQKHVLRFLKIQNTPHGDLIVGVQRYN